MAYRLCWLSGSAELLSGTSLHTLFLDLADQIGQYLRQYRVEEKTATAADEQAVG